MLQGAKRLTIGAGLHAFAAGGCAVSSIDLPFTTQVTDASAARPYVGVELRFDAEVAANLLLDMPERAERDAPTFAFAHADEDVLDPVECLLRLLDRSRDIPVLAPQYERELTYRLLQGPMGGTLRQIVQTSARFDQIRTAVAWIRAHAHEPMCVKRLAASVGMSVTSFHCHFKAVTTQSPLAYQRHLRLLDAQRLLASGSTNVTAAAF